VGRASPVLTPRWVAFAAIAGGLVAYYLLVGRLWEATLWWDIAWLDLVLLPAVFALVYLALPAWRARGLGVLALAFAVLAVAFEHESLDIAANFAKLAAVTFGAWWFLSFFESLAWVVIVASIIPFVDGYSVWRGPTHHIVEKRQDVFSALSFAFPAPGDLGSANLGLPDLLFFALFLASTARWALRTPLTWGAMVASFGLTMALAVGLDVNGLPALPLLSIAFLAANADLMWRRYRRRDPVAGEVR